jgi:hypothetical protein
MPGWKSGIGHTIDPLFCTVEHPIRHQCAVVHDHLASSLPRSASLSEGYLLLEERPVTAR